MEITSELCDDFIRQSPEIIGSSPDHLHFYSLVCAHNNTQKQSKPNNWLASFTTRSTGDRREVEMLGGGGGGGKERAQH